MLDYVNRLTSGVFIALRIRPLNDLVMNLLLQSLLLFCLLVSVGDCKYAINVHTCSFDSEELNLSCKMAKSGEYGPDRRLAGIVKLTLMVTSGRQTTLMDLELMPDLRQLEILGPCDAVTVKKADKVAKICQTVRKRFILV